MLDLLKIARTEASGENLFGLLSNLFVSSEIKPKGYPDAIIWQGGHHDGDVNPVAHSLTDAYALLGTIAAIDVLGLPFFAVPMWAQYRHDLKLEPLSWFETCPALPSNGQLLAMLTLTTEQGVRLLYWGNLVMRHYEHRPASTATYGLMVALRWFDACPACPIPRIGQSSMSTHKLV